MKIKYLKPLQEEADVVREDGKHVDHVEGSLQEGHLKSNLYTTQVLGANWVVKKMGTFLGAQANRIRNSRKKTLVHVRQNKLELQNVLR